MRRPRLLMISTVHSFGHARNTQKIAIGLAEEGFEVELWSRGKRPASLPEQIHTHCLEPRGKVVRWLDLPAALGRMLTGGHDLVIVAPPETVPLGILAKLFGKRVLWDVEEDATAAILHSDWIPPVFRHGFAVVYRIFEQAASRLLDGVSLAEESYLPRFRRSRHCEVVRNYPPKPKETLDLSRGDAAKTRWSLPGPRLTYVGVVTQHRGIADVVSAVGLLESKFPDIRFDVIGPIPRVSYRHELELVKSRLSSPERVTFHGLVPFAQLDQHLANAQIGMLPLHPMGNFIGSQPTKLYEYALAGLPVVVSDVPLWRVIPETSKSGEVATPGNPKAFADAIERLWKQGSDALRNAGQRAHDLVYEKNWFWEVERRRLATMIREILGEKR